MEEGSGEVIFGREDALFLVLLKNEAALCEEAFDLFVGATFVGLSRGVAAFERSGDGFGSTGK